MGDVAEQHDLEAGALTSAWRVNDGLLLEQVEEEGEVGTVSTPTCRAFTPLSHLSSTICGPCVR